MSARAWDTINYSRVASVCMKNNKKQFEVSVTHVTTPCACANGVLSSSADMTAAYYHAAHVLPTRPVNLHQA